MPLRVYLFAIACAFVGLLLFFPVRPAHAFEVSGETYPDTLAGVTVTLNSRLTQPPSNIVGTWWSLHTTTVGAASGNASSYFFCEAPPTNNPWFWYVSNTNSTQSGGTNGQRYGYDGRTGSGGGWWGLASGVSRPTVTFYDYPGDSLLTNQQFIIWVVGNSDYHSRYDGLTWNNPSVAWYPQYQNFAWAMDENNVTSNLRIYYSSDGSSYSIVQTYMPSGYEGAYVPSQSGYYRFEWSYTTDSAHTFVWDSTHITLTSSPTEPQYLSYAFDSDANYLSVRFSLDGAKPVQVKLQYLDGSSWVDVATQSTITTDNTASASGYYAYFSQLPVSAVYRVVCLPIGSEFELGQINLDEDSGTSILDFLEDLWNRVTGFFEQVASYFVSLIDWIIAWVSSIGDMFLWLPVEIRMLIIDALVIMLVVGFIGWFKR